MASPLHDKRKLSTADEPNVKIITSNRRELEDIQFEMNDMCLIDEPDKEFLREKYFRSIYKRLMMDERCKDSLNKSFYNLQCNDEPAPTNTLTSSNNLGSYANASAFNKKHNEHQHQESFDYYNSGFNYNNTTPYNTYYNVKQISRNDQPFLAIRSANNTLLSQNKHKRDKRPSPILGTPPTPLMNGLHDDLHMHLRICSSLKYTIDSDPPVPESRSYTIVGNYKVGFPQMRQLMNTFTDPVSNIVLQAGVRVRVIGPSPEPPRGRLRVKYQHQFIDVPHFYFHRLTEFDIWKSIQSVK